MSNSTYEVEQWAFKLRDKCPRRRNTATVWHASELLEVRQLLSGTTPGVEAAANNQPPTVVNPIGDVVVGGGATQATIDLSNVFSDPQNLGLQLSVASNTNPFLINARLNGTNLDLRFLPGLNASGVITIRATNPQGQFVEDAFSVSFNANQVLNPPTVVNPVGNLTVDQGTSQVTVDLSDVFFDLEDSMLDLRVIHNSNLDFVDAELIGNELALTFVDPSQIDTAQVTIRAIDSTGLYVDHTFMVETIPVVNNPPTIANPVADVTVEEDAEDLVIDLSNVFADVEDTVLTLSITSNTNEGLVTTSLIGTDLTLDFLEHQFGNATITIRATDSVGEFIEDSFSVTVNSVNDLPVVDNPIADVDVDEDAPDTVIELTGVFSDIEDPNLTFSVLSSDDSLVDAQIVGSQLTLTYQTNQYGMANVTVGAMDSDGGFVEQTFQVTVNAINDVPTVVNPISDLSATKNSADSLIDLSSVFADVEDTNLVLSVESNSNEGLLAATLTGSSLNLDFVNGQQGTALITVRATDSEGSFVEETFEVTVENRGQQQSRGWFHSRSVITEVMQRIQERVENHHRGEHPLRDGYFTELRMKLSSLDELRQRLSWNQ